MNTPEHDTRFDELRWQAQEKARRGEADADAIELRIAAALRHPPRVDLTHDFAAAVAGIAAAQASGRAHVPAAVPAVPEQAQLEQQLLRALVFALALSAAVVVAWFGRGWVAELAAVLPGGSAAVGWSGIAALSLLGNWGFGALRRQLEPGPHAAA